MIGHDDLTPVGQLRHWHVLILRCSTQSLPRFIPWLAGHETAGAARWFSPTVCSGMQCQRANLMQVRPDFHAVNSIEGLSHERPP